MKRFSQYINEVSEPKQYRKPETDGGGGGGPSLKSMTGLPMPPDQAIAAGIASTAAGKASMKNASSTTNVPYQVTVKRGAPEIGSRIGDPIPTRIPKDSGRSGLQKAFNISQKSSNRSAATELILMKKNMESGKDE